MAIMTPPAAPKKLAPNGLRRDRPPGAPPKFVPGMRCFSNRHPCLTAAKLIRLEHCVGLLMTDNKDTQAQKKNCFHQDNDIKQLEYTTGVLMTEKFSNDLNRVVIPRNIHDDDVFGIASNNSVHASEDAPSTRSIPSPRPAKPKRKLYLPLPKAQYKANLQAAQRVYGKASRVFVGNLPAKYPDGLLALMVKESMSEYGKCYVWVTRNHPYKPYAIVQYTTRQDAMAAYYCGESKGLANRFFRVEW